MTIRNHSYIVFSGGNAFLSLDSKERCSLLVCVCFIMCVSVSGLAARRLVAVPGSTDFDAFYFSSDNSFPCGGFQLCLVNIGSAV